MVSPTIKWNHAQKWMVIDPQWFPCEHPCTTMEMNVSPEQDYHMLHDHVINGIALFPAAGYIVLVWKALANILEEYYMDLPVVFDSLTFHRATVLPKEGMF